MARTERFLAVGSKVVIKQKGQQAVWYTLKKEVLVQKSVETLCLLTQDPVQTMTEQGIDLYFPARVVRSRIVLEDGDVDPNLFQQQLSMIDYDVPSSTGFSPCARLYRVAVPMTESVWLVRSGDVPWKLIAEMEDMGCKVDVTALDPKETRKKVCRAIDALQRKVNEKIASAQASLERAYQKLAQSEEQGIDEDKAKEAYEKQIKVIEKSIEKLQKDMTEGARRFGINSQSYNPEALSTAKTVIRFTATERARAYSRGAELLAQVGTQEASSAAALANNSELPAFIMSDMLRDAGHEEAADELNETFRLTDDSE